MAWYSVSTSQWSELSGVHGGCGCRDALLCNWEADELYLVEGYAQGQRHVVPPLLSDACATPMDGARLIKWMSSCWWMALV